MPSDSVEYGQRILPRWARGFWADKFTAVVFGVVGDALKAAGKASALSSLVEYAPDDAVPAHARARGMDRVAGETIASWRLRLLDAWGFWSTLHSHNATFRDFEAALRLYCQLPTQLFLYDYLADGDDFLGGAGGGLEDSNYENWSRFAIVIQETHGWVRPVVGPGLVVGPDLMVGLSMTSTELARIRRYFQAFKPGHTVGTEIWVLLDGTPAEDLLADHTASSEVVRIPLDAPAVGYPYMMVGPTLVVGQGFT